MCGSDEFECVSDSSCVPLKYVCSGDEISSCSDGSDESVKTCGKTTFASLHRVFYERLNAKLELMNSKMDIIIILILITGILLSIDLFLRMKRKCWIKRSSKGKNYYLGRSFSFFGRSFSLEEDPRPSTGTEHDQEATLSNQE